MTFDSLGGSHKAVSNNLNRWLEYEARDKLPDAERYSIQEAEYLNAEVPKQGNLSDCGVYLIHYVRVLLSDPEKVVRFLEVSAWVRGSKADAAETPFQV